MKKRDPICNILQKIIPLLIFSVVTSCQSKSPIESNKIKIENHSVSIDIEEPHAQGYSKRINKIINVAVDELLLKQLSIKGQAQSKEQAIDNIKQLYSKSKWASYQFSMQTRWRAYHSKDILSLVIESSIYTGGAHPNNITTVLNFDLQKDGNRVDFSKLIINNNNLRELLVEYFLTQKNLPLTTTGKEAGLFVEFNELPISTNILFRPTSLRFIYNQYEIAPYSMGVINIDVTYDQLDGVLDIADLVKTKIVKVTQK